MNKYEEARKRLSRWLRLNQNGISCSFNAKRYYEILFEALDKQVPRKPIVKRIDRIHHYSCPMCDKTLMPGFPCRCGQMIDWE